MVGRGPRVARPGSSSESGWITAGARNRRRCSGSGVRATATGPLDEPGAALAPATPGIPGPTAVPPEPAPAPPATAAGPPSVRPRVPWRATTTTDVATTVAVTAMANQAW